MQSDGVDLAKRRSRALSVGEPRCTALSSGDIAVFCWCTASLPEALAQIDELPPERHFSFGWFVAGLVAYAFLVIFATVAGKPGAA